MSEEAVAEPAGTPTGSPGRNRHVIGFTRDEGWIGWFSAKLRRQPFFGLGAIEVQPERLILQGQQRTWLGASINGELLVPRERLVRATRFRDRLKISWRRTTFGRRSIECTAEGEDEAKALVAELSAPLAAANDAAWLELQQFNARTRAESSFPWTTMLLSVACVAVFVAMVLVGNGAQLWFDGPTLLAWGANSSAHVPFGEWWRLLTHQFLHANGVHLLLNLWVLLQTGRLTERIYGHWTFLALYLLSGCVAGIASLAWHSPILSVGASGAIFGLIGAFLVSLTSRRSVPSSFARAYLPSTIIFVIYNLLAGAGSPVTDNAAHVGGLVAGALLGIALLRPWNTEGVRSGYGALRFTTALGALAAAVLGVVAWTGLASRERSASEAFFAEHRWLLEEEAKAIAAENQLMARLGAGTISDMEVNRRLEQDVVPVWTDIAARLRAEKPEGTKQQLALRQAVLDFFSAKEAWAKEFARVTGRAADADQQKLERAGLDVRRRNALLQRLTLRETAVQQHRSLATRKVLRVSKAPPCVMGTGLFARPADSDAPEDFPALSRANLCHAQALFMTADYRALDAMLERQLATNERLAGGSVYENSMGALDTLFGYGNLEITDAMRRMGEWRRAVPSSIHAELAEASLLQAWAWAARGHGRQDTVSGQGWLMFADRLEMAFAGLEELGDRGRGNPVWHDLRLHLALERDEPQETREALFRDAIERFPDELSLHAARIRMLLPRWGGTHEQVKALIEEAVARSLPGDALVRYAQLYSTDYRFENEEIDFFKDTPVEWPRMRDGLTLLTERYPQSDYMLNQLAFFSCVAGDETTFATVRPRVEQHMSASAWSRGTTLEICDRRMRGGKAKIAAAP